MMGVGGGRGGADWVRRHHVLVLQARKHIQQVRHDSEFVLAERMAAHGLLK